MEERPILFSSEMVKAILEGRKTMTRRVNSIGEYYISDKKCPYGSVGDRLWVRETWYYEEHMHDSTEGMPDLPCGLYSHRLVYKADCTDYPVNVGVGRQGWKPSIFMPRWASRITLEITDIKVERLQDITKEDAIAEGIHLCAGIDEEGCTHGYHWSQVSDTDLLFNSAADAYRKLWDSINGRKPGKTWKDNPWVWVVEFRRVGDV